MSRLSFKPGDATKLEGDDPIVLAHIVNDRGGWGKGFVLAVSRRWREPENAYRTWAHGRRAWGNDDASGTDLSTVTGPFGLGEVQFVEVNDPKRAHLQNPSAWVANMVAQHGYRTASNLEPLDYDALARCLDRVATFAADYKAVIHMPRIGCGLAHGRWERVQPIIEAILVCHEVRAVVHDQPSRWGRGKTA